MLKLESLELSGFKSFAEKLQLDFHSNVTSIVGPNGCGKSNLFDAIGWVLGAQNARYLRGEKMEDLIFSGTGKRKQSGVAQVKLTIGLDEAIPIVVNGREFVQDRLEVCRKLYRTGESLYLINQRRCRLLDVQNILEEAGLGFSSYAFIAQGRIETLLTGKPQDRRAVVEEAAGILAYKSRRRRAEVRLELARQNLLRVNDIVSEVEKQLRSLKRQASKARRYRELVSRFKDVQKLRFSLERERLAGELKNGQGEKTQLSQRETDARDALCQAEEEHAGRTRVRDQLENGLSKLQARSGEVRLETDRTLNSIRYLNEQQESAKRFLVANQVEQKTLHDSLQILQRENQTLKIELSELEIQEKRIEKELEMGRDQHRMADRSVLKSEEEVEETRRNILRLSSLTASLRNLEEQLRQRIRVFKPRLDRLAKEKQQTELAVAKHEELLEEALQALRTHQGAVESILTQRNQLELRRSELDPVLAEAMRAERELNDRLIALRERLHSLQEVEVSRSQYSEGVRKLLQHLGKSTVQAAGTLADCIETQPQYENLVEEFLDQQLEYVLVNSMDQAFAGLEELRSLKSGKCTFLSIHTSNGFGASNVPTLSLERKPEEGVYGTLAELLEMNEEVGAAFRRVLPGQAEAIVVSDMDRAVALSHTYPESTFITLQGESLSSRGLLSSCAGGSKKLGLLSLKRQKRELDQRISQLEKEAVIARHRRSEMATQLDEIKLELHSCQADLSELEKTGIRLENSRDRLLRDATRQQRSRQVVADEVESVKEEASQLENRLTETSRQAVVAGEEMKMAEGLLEQEQRTLAECRAESQRTQDDLYTLDSQKQVLVERRKALEQTLHRIREQADSWNHRTQSALEAAHETEDRWQRIADDLKNAGQKQQHLENENQDLEKELAQAQKEYEGWRSQQPEHDARLKSLREQAAELREIRASLDIGLARIETHFLTLQEQCREQMNLDLEEVAAEVSIVGIDREVISREFEDLRQRKESFGPVNMTALAEFQEGEERQQFLTTQRTDIESSIADTQKAIRDLNRRSRQRFVEAFEAVNRYFQEYFDKLFGGGECGMRLLDEEDFLESGIDIFAQPPGKKLQNVMLLSGGEKALTVLALLMGLFAYRPSRFCVLDEVDAPLDDNNVDRFARLVREMSEKIQMILITHNKRTMEVADVLYGVTMADPGVSQVVSVEF